MGKNESQSHAIYKNELQMDLKHKHIFFSKKKICDLNKMAYYPDRKRT